MIRARVLGSIVVSLVFGAVGCGHAQSGGNRSDSSPAKTGTAGVNGGSLPLADLERERFALEMFHSGLSPEEYAARFGHEWVSFSFDDYRYRQPGLTEWVHRLGDIFFHRNGAPSLREVRQRFLTPDEIKAVEQQEREPL